MKRYYRILIYLYSNPIKCAMHFYFIFGMLSYMYEMLTNPNHIPLSIFILNLLIMSPIIYFGTWLYAKIMKFDMHAERCKEKLKELEEKQK